MIKQDVKCKKRNVSKVEPIDNCFLVKLLKHINVITHFLVYFILKFMCMEASSFLGHIYEFLILVIRCLVLYYYSNKIA